MHSSWNQSSGSVAPQVPSYGTTYPPTAIPLQFQLNSAAAPAYQTPHYGQILQQHPQTPQQWQQWHWQYQQWQQQYSKKYQGPLPTGMLPPGMPTMPNTYSSIPPFPLGAPTTQPPPPDSMPPPSTDKETVEDFMKQQKIFDEQFESWETSFMKWKEQNANHPDKTQYKEFETKWENLRDKMIQKRELLHKKREAKEAEVAAAAAAAREVASTATPVATQSTPYMPNNIMYSMAGMYGTQDMSQMANQAQSYMPPPTSIPPVPMMPPPLHISDDKPFSFPILQQLNNYNFNDQSRNQYSSFQLSRQPPALPENQFQQNKPYDQRPDSNDFYGDRKRFDDKFDNRPGSNLKNDNFKPPDSRNDSLLDKGPKFGSTTNTPNFNSEKYAKYYEDEYDDSRFRDSEPPESPQRNNSKFNNYGRNERDNFSNFRPNSFENNRGGLSYKFDDVKKDFNDMNNRKEMERGRGRLFGDRNRPDGPNSFNNRYRGFGRGQSGDNAPRPNFNSWQNNDFSKGPPERFDNTEFDKSDSGKPVSLLDLPMMKPPDTFDKNPFGDETSGRFSNNKGLEAFDEYGSHHSPAFEKIANDLKKLNKKVEKLENNIYFILSRQIITKKLRKMKTTISEIRAKNPSLARQIRKHLIECNRIAHPNVDSIS